MLRMKRGINLAAAAGVAAAALHLNVPTKVGNKLKSSYPPLERFMNKRSFKGSRLHVRRRKRRRNVQDDFLNLHRYQHKRI